MKKIFVIFLCLLNLFAGAQSKKNKTATQGLDKGEKYFSFNPLGLGEPQMAIGAGFGCRFSKRSEYFTELSFLLKTPFYSYQANSLKGFRFLGQYRYHLRINTNRFIGAEFRLKMYDFTGTNTFVNNTSHDTLKSVSYNANAISLGGAIVFGNTYTISKNRKWKIEITAGIGAKQKLVSLKGALKDYEVIIKRKLDGIAPPYIFEAVGMPYIPCTIRLKYLIN
ncbi:DUF3575 domain-containing protein [Ferruginibacter sp.]|nr:DUF3575 domain-containing protein [Ferruginibacter sp.]